MQFVGENYDPMGRELELLVTGIYGVHCAPCQKYDPVGRELDPLVTGIYGVHCNCSSFIFDKV